jgi:cupin 2 domain-containing protein
MLPSGMIKAGNIKGGLPSRPLDDEVADILVEGRDLCIERIVSTGQATPEGQWYNQETDEFVLVVAGAARLRIEGEDRDRELAQGDWLLLPAHRRHRVAWTLSDPPTIWLAVHFSSD